MPSTILKFPELGAGEDCSLASFDDSSGVFTAFDLDAAQRRSFTTIKLSKVQRRELSSSLSDIFWR